MKRTHIALLTLGWLGAFALAAGCAEENLGCPTANCATTPVIGAGAPVVPGAPVVTTAVNPNLDPSSFYGLYWEFNSGYTYIGPDGRFVLAAPKFRSDGSFDYDATIATGKIGPHRQGTFTSEPDPARQGGVILHMTGRGGRNFDRRLHRSSSGTWIMLPKSSKRLGPAMQTRFDGAIVSKRSLQVGGEPDSTGTPSETLEVGSQQTLSLAVDGTFTWRDQTYQIGSGGPAPTTVLTWSDFQVAQGQGTYRLDGIFITLNFDNGVTVRDYFHHYPPDLTVIGPRYFSGALE